MSLPIPATIAPVGFPPVAETLMPAIQSIVAALHPQKIILFGSYACGNPTPDSDVDLLIIWDTDKPRRERVVAVSLALYPRPFPVDILVKTPRELVEELPHNFLLREILEKGVVLYERG
jgi:predicted nucleotidyltransferase